MKQGEYNYVQDLEALNEFIIGPLGTGGALNGFPGSQNIIDVLHSLLNSRVFLQKLS
jgi:hypothetical protein